MAVPTLLATQFLLAQPDWPGEEMYIPEWRELVRIVIPLLSIRGNAADLVRFCERQPCDISRYFAWEPNHRREPDGEVALATLDWVTRWRVEHSLVETCDNPAPPLETWQALERAFNRELELKLARERVEGRKFYLSGTDLFDELPA